MTGDSILKGLTHPEDILLQTSPSGSYRCGHVIEFLAFILPVAQTAEDSCMVILDRFAPHMSEEVEQLVAEYGHLYDVLGGGQTMSGQVGDTHRHGPLRAEVRRREDADFSKHRYTKTNSLHTVCI